MIENATMLVVQKTDRVEVLSGEQQAWVCDCKTVSEAEAFCVNAGYKLTERFPGAALFSKGGK